jgi:hypothetical protein
MKASARGLLSGLLLTSLSLLTACEERTGADATRAADRNGSASGAATRARSRAADRSRPERGRAPLCAFRNVHFIVEQDLVLEVRHLAGRFEKTGPNPAAFDDPASFSISIADAEVALDMRSLAAMMNRYVFPGEDAPLRDLEIAAEGERLRIHGKMRKGVVVPFTMVGKVSATPQGEVEIVPVELHAAGVPVRGLLDFFGVELDDLVKENDTVGARVEENAMFLEPKAILPPPRLNGRIVEVRVEGDRLIQRFDGLEDAGPIEPRGVDGGNTMTFQGGVLQFGRLTMEPTDLTLVDDDPSDPFLFSLAEYQKHLVAGYSRTLADGSLVTMMPDYDQAGQPLATSSR